MASHATTMGNVFSESCPARAFLSKISNKWALLVIDALGANPKRTIELKTHLDGISQKVLSDVLKDLIDLKVIKREQIAIYPPHVEYSLTSKGKSLRQVVAQLDRWVEQNYG